MPLKIYYLDEEPDLLEVFVDTFSDPKLEIQTFTQPSEFLAAIQTQKPDLAFLDYRLPRTTGIEVAQKMPSEIPKILVTGDMNINANGIFITVLEKPVDPNEMLSIIESYVQKCS